MHDESMSNFSSIFTFQYFAQCPISFASDFTFQFDWLWDGRNDTGLPAGINSTAPALT